MPSPSIRFGLAAAAAAGLGVLAAWLPAASAGQGQARGQAQGQAQPKGRGQDRLRGDDDPLQVLADVVLIETRCRTLTVDYGRLFAYAEGAGIAPPDIMPTGPRRPAFEAALRGRTRDASTDQLCGPLAADRAARIPGLFSPR